MNGFSPLTLQKLAEELDRIRVNLDNIDLAKQSEKAIKVELQQINYSSWSAIQQIEKDITER